jgi:Rod binding domain-containing protein
MTSLDGLPAVPSTAIPARIREQGAEAEQAYRVALSFERQLVGQLTKALQASAGGGEEGAGAVGAAYADVLPGAMADAVTAGGGTGLAEELYRALRPEAT